MVLTDECKLDFCYKVKSSPGDGECGPIILEGHSRNSAKGLILVSRFKIQGLEQLQRNLNLSFAESNGNYVYNTRADLEGKKVYIVLTECRNTGEYFR